MLLADSYEVRNTRPADCLTWVDWSEKSRARRREVERSLSDSIIPDAAQASQAILSHGGRSTSKPNVPDDQAAEMAYGRAADD
jgi:hypothetical protein